jgi:ABC-type nitrate/sulfonate/bicarbonate transport system substrate-binding protein
MKSNIQTILLLVVTVLLAGCNQPAATTSPAPPAPASPPREITIQLDWVHTIEYAGFYMAEEKGYFAAENLKLTMIPYDFEKPVKPVEAVTAGQAEFGVANAPSMLLAHADGAPLVAIATIYQRNPSALISLAEKNIAKPEDLVGKRVMIDVDDPSSTGGLLFTALIVQQQGIDPKDIEIVPRTDWTNAPLLNGDVDVMDAFITNQPVQLEREGHKVNAILPSDYGVDMYADAIFTTEAMVTNEPEVVERFLRALTRGIQDAVDNPEEAAKLAVARGQDLDLQSETESMLRSLPLLKPAGSKPGMMTDKTWELTGDIMIAQGVLDKSFDMKTAYTLYFLNKIYSQ